MMSPTLSGHPLILAEICTYLHKPQLRQLLCVDRELYHIAGKALYRHLVVRASRPSPFSRDLFGHQPQKAANPLLLYVKLLDIDEADLEYVSRLCETESCGPTELPRLKTLVLRASVNPYADGTLVLGEGIHPELLVIVGDMAALGRITSYFRSGQGDANDESKGPVSTWPSVRRLHHILPYVNPSPYPTDFIVESPDHTIDSALPNLLEFAFFFDIEKVERDGEHDSTPSRTESHVLRSIAWLIRNTRRDLPITIWLSAELEPRFIRRKAFIKEMVRQPKTRAARYEPLWEQLIFKQWDDELLSKRLALVRAVRTGEKKEVNWCCVADGDEQYEADLLSEAVRAAGQVAGGDYNGYDDGYDQAVDLRWDEVIARDDGEEDLFANGDSEEESDEESDEDSDPYSDYGYGRGYGGWGRGRYESYGYGRGGYGYGRSYSDESEEDTDLTEEDEEELAEDEDEYEEDEEDQEVWKGQDGVVPDVKVEAEEETSQRSM